MKKHILVAGAAVAVGLATAGCGGSDSGGEKKSAYTIEEIQEGMGKFCDSECKDQLTLEADPSSIDCSIAAMSPTTSNPSNAELISLFEDRVNKWFPNVKASTTNANSDPVLQASQMDTLVAKGVDVIIISVADTEALAPAVEAAQAQGVKVVSVDRKVPTEVTTTVQPNNYDMGVQQGEAVAERMGEEGRVAIVYGTPGVTEFGERTDGFMDAVEPFPGIQVVAQVNGDNQTDTTYNVTQNLLTKEGSAGLDWIVTQSDVMALGIVRALEESGQDDVKVAAMDAHDPIMTEIKKETVEFTIPYPQTVLHGLVAAAKVCAGEPVDKTIGIAHPLIDKSNVDEYFGMNGIGEKP
ncbi:MULTISPECIES: sugar ABC transporter substrate-binding protein [unclassified Nocardioides]|uniref:sugar ABC transporter substrate-binding protein n=1 Tax=unclassified Nocardioides TaxID=2615069 RepID=UPI000A26CEC9|nr:MULTISPECIES: sugar ABC transporter substrate-binding protein [unclassified Nocardioides]